MQVMQALITQYQRDLDEMKHRVDENELKKGGDLVGGAENGEGKVRAVLMRAGDGEERGTKDPFVREEEK